MSTECNGTPIDFQVTGCLGHGKSVLFATRPLPHFWMLFCRLTKTSRRLKPGL